MRYFLKSSLVLTLLVLLSCCSCGILRRTVTVTKTEVRIDTVIHIVRDTVPVIREVEVTDTVIIENTTAIARSYINRASGKLTLELKGKPFDQVVQMSRTTTEKKTDIVKPKVRWYVFYCLGILTVILIIVFYKKVL